jgi:hypothetical protein
LGALVAKAPLFTLKYAIFDYATLLEKSRVSMTDAKNIARTLETFEDEFSYQIASTADPRFWFRLEKRSDHIDVITDYFLGTFEQSAGGAVLAECYRKLGRKPESRIVFRDIVPSTIPSGAESAASRAAEKYVGWTRELLQAFGRQNLAFKMRKERDKYHLEITAYASRAAGMTTHSDQ